MKPLTIIDRLCHLSFRLASVLTILLVLLTVEQVVARYLFNASSIALQELEWYLFGACITLPMAYGYKKDTHVRVDFISRLCGARLMLWRERVGITLLIGTLVVLLYYSVPYVTESLSFENLRPRDYYTSQLISEPDSTLYKSFATVEGAIRSTILSGEVSPDPGGLEARWLVKAFFPLGIFLLLLQSLTMLLATIKKDESDSREVSHGS